MRIKLDESMPLALAIFLRSAGHDVSTVAEENLSGQEDHPVLEAAAKEGRLLMTFDMDFGDIRSYPVGSHAGVVIFRLHDQRWAVLKEPVERLLKSALIDRLQYGIAVVDENRVRVRSKKKGE
jgi:predicted nuclease of predicted toxin-antitoxin system